MLRGHQRETHQKWKNRPSACAPRLKVKPEMMSTSPRASEASPRSRHYPHAACPSSSSCITTTLSYFSLNKRESQRECLWKAISTCSAPWLSIDSAMCRRKESRLSPSSCRTLQCDQNSDTQQCNRTWIEWGSDPAKLLSIWRPQPKQNGAEICIWSIALKISGCMKISCVWMSEVPNIRILRAYKIFWIYSTWSNGSWALLTCDSGIKCYPRSAGL